MIIQLESPGGALYIHKRVGKNGREFACLKFRSMRLDADPNKLAESETDDRITKVGQYARKYSLDELPQLVNVLLGDMSIVGPRPALPVQVKNFSEEENYKLAAKPGITGWTQINGRNSIPYERRMELDVWYARNYTFWLDLYIIFKTPFALLGSGIYDKNSTSPTK